MNRRSFLAAILATSSVPTARATAQLTATVAHPPGDSALATMVAGMVPGEWLEMTPRPANMDAGLSDLRGPNTQTLLTYCGAQCHDPIAKRLWGAGSDHGGKPAKWEYDIASNTFLPTVTGSGSHGFQHQASNTVTGEKYILLFGKNAIYKWNPDGIQTKVVDMPYLTRGHMIAAAIAWWPGQIRGGGAQGALIFYNGNSQTLEAWNPLTGEWTSIASKVIPGIVGVYHNVSAYSHAANCLVYGGGNGGNSPQLDRVPNNRVLYRLNADGTTTRIPDAPKHLGVFHGMALCGDGAGKFLLTGGGECWRLDPIGGGTMTRVANPPAALLDAMQHASSVSVAVDELGCAVFLDYDRVRSPKARMWVRKA